MRKSSLFHGRHADGGDTPCDHDDGQELARVGLSEPQVTGKLAEQIADVESTDARVPDGVTHVEIFLEAGKTSVGDVDAIEVAMLALVGRTGFP